MKRFSIYNAKFDFRKQMKMYHCDGIKISYIYELTIYIFETYLFSV